MPGAPAAAVRPPSPTGSARDLRGAHLPEGAKMKIGIKEFLLMSCWFVS